MTCPTMSGVEFEHVVSVQHLAGFAHWNCPNHSFRQTPSKAREMSAGKVLAIPRTHVIGGCTVHICNSILQQEMEGNNTSQEVNTGNSSVWYMPWPNRDCVKQVGR